MRKTGITIIFLFALVLAKAQKPCERSSVYFDVDKDELSEKALLSIATLVSSLKGYEYLIELYGFADSVASSEYNSKLAQRRINAVRKTFNSYRKFKFTFFENNMGEADKEDLALARRVDIFHVPKIDDGVILSEGKASLTVPDSYFGNCGVCQSKPRIKSYYTAEEAREENIEFLTSDGEQLITAGTFDFDFEGCEDVNPKEKICYQISAEELDMGMSVWFADTIDGKVRWKESDVPLTFDEETNTYNFCTSEQRVNLDRPEPDAIDTINLFKLPKASRYNTSLGAIKSDQVDKSTADTFYSKKEGLLWSTIGEGKQVKHIQVEVTDLEFTTLENMRLIEGKESVIKEYIIPVEMFDSFGYQDSKLKLKIKLDKQMGFYWKEARVFVPIDSFSKFKGYSHIPAQKFKIAYTDNGGIYAIGNRHLKKKLKKRKNLLKLKVKKRNLKKFRRIKSY